MVRDAFLLYQQVPVAPPRLVLRVSDAINFESSRYQALRDDGTFVLVEVLNKGAVNSATRGSPGFTTAKMNLDAR